MLDGHALALALAAVALAALAVLQRAHAAHNRPVPGRWVEPEDGVQPGDPVVVETAGHLAICRACGRAAIEGGCAGCRLVIERDMEGGEP